MVIGFQPARYAAGIAILFLMLSNVGFAHVAVTLQNADMETGYLGGIAGGWTAFWVSNGVSGSPTFFDSTSIKHRNSHAQGINLTGVGTSDNVMLKCYTGIYQQVPATPGRTYTASAWHYIDMPSSTTNVVSVSVGIDPSGSTDPTAANVVWSIENWNGSGSTAVGNWKQMLCTAIASSNTITIFLRVVIIPYRATIAPPNKVYFDQVYLMESTTEASEGILANPSFELGFVRPDLMMLDAYPNNWLPFGSAYGTNNNSGIHVGSANASPVPDGSYYLEIAHGYGKPSTNGWGVCQQVRVTPGYQYEVYVRTKGSGYNQTRSVGIDPTGSITVPSSQTIWANDSNDDGQWRMIHAGPVVPVSDKVTVILRTNGTFLDGNRTAWFDAVEFLQQGGEIIPPAAVTNLTAYNATPTTIDLSWTCTGDDGNLGAATTQVVKYSTQPITEDNWHLATAVPNVPVPGFHGTNQSMTVTGLTPGTRYYFAIKLYDECSNASPISNVASAVTQTDTVPPSRITNLSVAISLSDSVQLSWTAPAETTWNGTTQAAASYEIRYSTQPINNSNWSSATIVTVQVPPQPAAPGNIQTTWVRGLAAGTTYYFAIRSRDVVGNLSDTSNSPSRTTASQGTAPYWAYMVRNKLQSWYASKLAEAQDADADITDPNPFNWYYDSIDKDCEAQPGLAAILQIVRDPYLLAHLGRVSDHVWWLTYANTNIDSNIFRSTGQKVPTWNESHHLGEVTWNGVGLIAVDYDNPKWLQRAIEYCRHLTYWTGYTGDESTGGPHLHFRSMWFRGDEYDHTDERPYCLVDTPEDRRLTRAPFYAAWKDPNSRMTTGQLIKDWLAELDTATVEDAMKTDLNKPLGLIPGEIRFDNHRIGGYSGLWWKMASSLGGTPGTSSEWWWDWGVGWVQARDAYYELVDQYIVSGYPKYIIPVRETIRHFSIDSAINNIPPQYMFINNDEWYKGPIAPWPDYNDPWGGYQYYVNYLYRLYTGDTQFDEAWLGHANVLWQVLPPPGARRCQRMIRSTLTWTGHNIDSDSWQPWKAVNPFFMAWVITKDKEWLCRALDEMGDSGPWMETMYTGVPGVGINRLPDQPITWNNTNKYTNWACLVLDWDNTHIKWITYNFDAQDRTIPIWLWSLKPGNYILKYGRDTNLDDEMDSVEGIVPFTYNARRTEIPITLPSNRMQVFEIVPAEKTLHELKALADGTPISLNGCLVTAVFDGFFYVEKTDRSAGIRIESLAKVQPGDMVNLTGYMTTVSGERCLKCLNAPVISRGNPIPKPLSMNNRSLGGGPSGLQRAVSNGLYPAGGVSNIGLLVRTTGRVIARDTGCIYIDDGSACWGGIAHSGIKVITSQSPDIGSYVVVTGISSCEIPLGETEPVRVLRAVPDGVCVIE
jgi:hypothetical protein